MTRPRYGLVWTGRDEGEVERQPALALIVSSVVEKGGGAYGPTLAQLHLSGLERCGGGPRLLHIKKGPVTLLLL